jgi:hypothetical protein
MLATPPPRSLLCEGVRRKEVNRNKYGMGKRISRNEVELLKADRLTVQKKKELTTRFASLFLAHSRKSKDFSHFQVEI